MNTRRQTWLVNNKLQLTILLYGVALGLGSNIVTLTFQLATEKQLSMLSSRQTFYFAICLAFFFYVLLVLLGLYVSNKIAGPIHNLKNHINETLENKNPKPLQFRPNDYFSEIVEPYNELLKKIK
jgi:signal transduction histidine kinase